jgi:sulfur-carrier protein adenylyltransferase/sulfurtransferase
MFWFGNKGKPKLKVVAVSAEEASEQLKVNKQARMVDVREPREWAATGVPPKAVRISLGNLERKAPEKLPTDGPVYLICASGHRSHSGGKILLKLGYSEVYTVSGGIGAWQRAGLPLKKS